MPSSKLFKFTFALVSKDTHDKHMDLTFAESSYAEAVAKLPSLVHPKFETQLSSVTLNDWNEKLTSH